MDAARRAPLLCPPSSHLHHQSSEGAAERKGKKWMMHLRSVLSTCTFLLDHVAHGRREGEGGAASATEKGLDAADVQDTKKEEFVTLSKKQKTSLILLRNFSSGWIVPRGGKRAMSWSSCKCMPGQEG